MEKWKLQTVTTPKYFIKSSYSLWASPFHFAPFLLPLTTPLHGNIDNIYPWNEKKCFWTYESLCSGLLKRQKYYKIVEKAFLR